MSAKAIQGLLKREQADEHFPELTGVDVWVAGATPDRRLGEARIRAIELFWETYFARSGARLTPERYGPALLNFSAMKMK